MNQLVLRLVFFVVVSLLCLRSTQAKPSSTCHIFEHVYQTRTIQPDTENCAEQIHAFIRELQERISLSQLALANVLFVYSRDPQSTNDYGRDLIEPFAVEVSRRLAWNYHVVLLVEGRVFDSYYQPQENSHRVSIPQVAYFRKMFGAYWWRDRYQEASGWKTLGTKEGVLHDWKSLVKVAPQPLYVRAVSALEFIKKADVHDRCSQGHITVPEWLDAQHDFPLVDFLRVSRISRKKPSLVQASHATSWDDLNKEAR